MNNKSKKEHYRPDIDGLRAFAVIPVILYHLNISGFSGGFMGVDVFFVISGYLITSILLRDLKRNTFSMLGFWERRVRRIVPALVVVLSTTLAASFLITLYPIDFKNFGLSLSAQSIFLSNMYFMRQVEYFAAPVDTIVLLHTWSLAVEEQFYILFPVVLFLIFTFCRHFLRSFVVLLFLASLVLSIYLVHIAPEVNFSIPGFPNVWGGATNLSAGFYFLPARAWELLLGALLVFFPFTIKRKGVSETLGFSGFLMLIWSFLALSHENSFPGLVALIPTLGTVFIILSGTSHCTYVKSFLAFPLFIGIGVLSYSLYLWHWPIIVLSRQVYTLEPSTMYLCIVLVLTGVLSLCTYYFVEIPFLEKKIAKKRREIFAFAIGMSIVLFAAGMYIFQQNGLPERAPEPARSIAEAATDFNPRREECFKNAAKRMFLKAPPCLMGMQDVESVDFVMWGNSHANVMMSVVDTVAKEKKLTGAFFAMGGCTPLVTKMEISTSENCIKLKQQARAYIEQNQIKHVLVISSWAPSYTVDNTQRDLQTLLQETLDAFDFVQSIYIMKQVPSFDNYDVRKVFYKSLTTNSFVLPSTPRSDYEKKNESVWKHIAANSNVTILNPVEALCSTDDCTMEQGGLIIYRDGSHMNKTGSAYLEPVLMPFFDNIRD